MTDTHLETRLSELKTTLAEQGYKLTHQRLEILRELVAAKDHPSAEAVFKRVRQRIPTISLDTVYRTLCTLETLGMAAKVCVIGDHGRFDADLTPHHHFICESCQQVLDFSWDEIEGLALPQSTTGLGRIERRQVLLHGICDRCLAGGPKPE